MNFYIVIPAHNEDAFLAQMLQSLVRQTHLPKKILIVDDASTDNTSKIIQEFSDTYNFISGVYHDSEKSHSPGSKIISAFYKGMEMLDSNFDIICKFDADLIFPKNYLEKVDEKFKKNPKTGMAGGFCYIEKNDRWVLENLTNKDHIRGALKAYRKKCFEQIGGLKNTMGWDTIDELLAKYHNWEVQTIPTLHVKHLKPTGESYTKASKYKQGEAFYKMRYGFLLTSIASAKLAWRKKDLSFFINCLKGYSKAKKLKIAFAVSKEEGIFIRRYRWRGIKHKLSFQKTFD